MSTSRLFLYRIRNGMTNNLRIVQLLLRFYSVCAGVYMHWFSGNSHCVNHASGTTERMELIASVTVLLKLTC